MQSRLDILRKHAKRFVVKGGSRPTYSQVHLWENGELFMTDSHRAVYASGVHELKPQTEAVKGFNGDGELANRSQMLRLFNQEYANTFELNTLDAFAGANAFEAITKSVDEKNPPLTEIEIKGGVISLNFESHDFDYWQASGSYEIGNTSKDKEFSCHVNTRYLLDCLALIRDLDSECFLKITESRHRPLEFSTMDEQVKIILLPVRKY